MVIQLIKQKRLDLEKLKNGQIDLTRINIKTLATQLDLLSSGVKHIYAITIK